MFIIRAYSMAYPHPICDINGISLKWNIKLFLGLQKAVKQE